MMEEDIIVSMSRKFINLSENFFTVSLSGAWKDFKNVQIKSRLIKENGKIRVSLFFDAELKNGKKQHTSLKFMVFEDPLDLERLATISIALSNLLQGELTPEQIKLQASRVLRNAANYYQHAIRALREESDDTII